MLRGSDKIKSQVGSSGDSVLRVKTQFSCHRNITFTQPTLINNWVRWQGKQWNHTIPWVALQNGPWSVISPLFLFRVDSITPFCCVRRGPLELSCASRQNSMFRLLKILLHNLLFSAHHSPTTTIRTIVVPPDRSSGGEGGASDGGTWKLLPKKTEINTIIILIVILWFRLMNQRH